MLTEQTWCQRRHSYTTWPWGWCAHLGSRHEEQLKILGAEKWKQRMWSLCDSLTSAICVVSTIVNYLERSRVLGGTETFPSRRKAMTELVMQTKKRLAVYPSLNLAMIFSLLPCHLLVWQKWTAGCGISRKWDLHGPAVLLQSIPLQYKGTASLPIRAKQHLPPASGVC